MKHYTKQITAFAVLSLFASAANAQTDTYSDTINDLNALAIGDLPTEITDVVDDINGYLTFEENKNTNLVGAVTVAEGVVTSREAVVTGLQTDATDKQTEINDAITNDPTDPNIPVLQAELVVIQDNIAIAQGEVAVAEAGLQTANTAVQNSDIKIALYNSVLVPETGTIAVAEAEAAAAAQTITDAITDFSTPNSSPDGLEGVIEEIESVTAGDPTDVTTAIVDANNVFQGIGVDAATVGNIQDLIIAIDTQLPSLPPITAVDQATAIADVTNGTYERVAIAVNAAGITTLNGDDTVIGSVASQVATNSTADQQYARDQDVLNSTADQQYAREYTDDLANGAVQTNTNDISALTETVFSDDLEAGSVGIAGVVEKRADGTIKLGENSFLLDDTTTSHVLTATNDGTGITATEIILGGNAPGTTETESVDIRVANDLFVDGDLNIAGLTGDVASRINSNSSAIANNSSRIASNKEDIEQNTRGIAMVAALQHTTVLPGMNNAFDLSAAHFEGETGLALNYARRINENVQVNFGAASTTDFDESVIKAGIGVQW